MSGLKQVKQVNGQDNSFVEIEELDLPKHIASATIYAQSTAPGGMVRSNQILAHLESRLHRSRLSRRDLVSRPMVHNSRSLVALAWALVLSVGMGCGGSTPTADSTTVREVAEGRLVGASTEEGAVHVWRGLPFAEPPVDSLRWRAPRAPQPWEGVREALESGSECSQLGGDPIMGGEDCLYLDVYAPAMDPEDLPTGPDRLPVMYWIHGGGNSMGAGNQLPPSALARDNGVIVVTINYRLGVFGWLSHPALRAGATGPEDASGNFGTLDMIRGLEWVRDNIASFGGNPDRVTIFGESAGGINVFSLLVSPRASGLFHAAISESGSPTSMSADESENYTDDPVAPGLPGSSSEVVIALLRQVGRAEDRETAKAVAAGMSPDEIEQFLRGFSTEEILTPFVELMDGAMPIYITPNVFQDGHVVSRGEVVDLLGTPGAYNAVPFIAGTNREESKLFFAMNSPHIETTFGMPSGFKNERLYDVEGEYGGLIWRAMGADEPISAMRKVQGPSVWAYRFDWDEEPSVLGMDLSKLIGAGHAVEMLFVFGLTDLGFANRFIFDDPPSAARLSAQMRSYWAHFAHTFRPGRGQEGDLPEWPPWGEGASDPKYLILDSDRDGGIELGSDRIDQGFVLDRAGKDPRLLNDEERCRVFRNFVQWSEALSVEEYAQVDGGLCEAWPLESRLFFPSLSHENES
jgi:para-nitrobenzyl esterase